ncbi:MAG: hypothetical protein M1832_002391 [Thelocarpon impressellum]|nr:MAG: hypothetical protein M1832_002391 [Thelocarpon impressellum]
MESQGSLGDSLNHYRKAYRMDSRVDRTYGEKHFPKSKACPPKPTNVNPSNAPATVTNTAHHSLEGSTASLTLSFANLSIPGLPPPTELSPPPPAPFTVLPSEMLVEILSYVAIRDVASFARLAQVCKHLAYLVATEDRIWRRVCEGPEVGFGAMHYRWACDILGGPLGDDGRGGSHLEGPYKDPDGDIPPQSPALPTPPTFLPIIRLPTQPTYALTFRHRPRIRFAGLYISTVNYVRPGASSPAQVSWNTPVHIVTYYRYLRFFRDGTVLSLLTTAEPAEVVHHLSRDFLAQQSAALPGSATVKSALRGRWRLSGTPELSGTTPSPSSRDLSAFGADDEESEGDIHIETEGPGDAKYTYKMHLALRSAGKAGGAGPRNTKLVWRGFWSYNRLTDDWAEFGLRNDRAFYWSRVRSYGMS